MRTNSRTLILVLTAAIIASPATVGLAQGGQPIRRRDVESAAERRAREMMDARRAMTIRRATEGRPRNSTPGGGNGNGNGGGTTTPTGGTSVLTPTNLQAQDLGNGRDVRVTFADANPSIDDTFELIRERQNGANWESRQVIPLAEVTFVDNPGLGTFRYQIRSVHTSGSSPFSTFSQVTVAQVIPTGPTGFQVADVGNGSQARLSWSDNSANESSFEIERQRDSGGSWVSLSPLTVAADVTQLTDTPGVGSFRYRIRATNSAGSSPWTAWVTPVIADIPPSAISDLNAGDLGNRSQVRLMWVDNSANESGFEFERETLVGSTWSNATRILAAANQSQLIDAPGLGRHRYRGRAVNGVGASPYGAFVEVLVQDSIPTAPGAFAAVDQGNGSSVRLTWTDNSSNETGFDIRRERLSGTTWTADPLLFVGANNEAFTDSPGAGTYRYSIRSVNTIGASAFSSPVQVVVAPVTPAAPSSLGAIDQGNASQVRLTWADNSSNEQAFEIARETQSGSTWGSRTTISVPANATAYVDSPGLGTHRYQVRAGLNGSWSAWTAFTQVTVASQTPSAPSGLLAVDVGGGVARLNWTDNSGNEQFFDVERNPAFSTAVSLGANATTYNDTAGPGTYSYRVRARNSSASSNWTGWTTVNLSGGTTTPPPGGGTPGVALSRDANGYSIFTPSADTRKIYVSASQGNNANDGLSPQSPVRTIAAGMALLRDGMPDHVYLRRGDTWDESLGKMRKSGRSPAEPLVIATYGDDPARPQLVTDQGMLWKDNAGGVTNIDNLVIAGIAVRPASGGAAGISWLDEGNNLLLEDLHIANFKDNIAIQGYNSVVRNVVVRKCVIVDASSSGSHSQGLYMAAVENVVVEDNVLDHNGWSSEANATIYNHNIYGQPSLRDAIIRRNIIARGASHGVQLRSGGIIEDNIFARNSCSVLLGGGDEPAPLGVTGAVRGNVVLEGKSINSNNPRGWGIDLVNINSQGAIVENNIIAHKFVSTDAHAILMEGNQSLGVQNATIRNNVIYNWRGPINIQRPSGGRQMSGHRVENNIVVDPSTSGTTPLIDVYSTDPSVARFAGNTYSDAGPSSSWFLIDLQGRSYQQFIAATGEQGATSSAPSLVDPTRTLGTYNAFRGGGNTLEAFMDRARQQNVKTWNASFGIDESLSYLRQGYQRQ